MSVAGVVLAAAAAFLLPAVLAVIMTGAGVAVRVPQLLLLVRRKSVANVSMATWLLSGATTACWLVVSVSRDATAVTVASVSTLAATAVLVGALSARRASARKDLADPSSGAVPVCLPGQDDDLFDLPLEHPHHR